jgi:glycosyltransferase involved in cell wall biosynthesis
LRVLVFHGYLLHGTGSNVYNARLGEALVRAGHELHLVCQDRDPLSLGWVDAAGDWDSGALSVVTKNEPARASVYRPDIGGILPVYVADEYEGVEARPFPELSDAEIEDYLERNVAAVREVCERVRPDVALANHLIMGPAVLARALGDAVPYAVKVHGSALEYTVKPHPRFLPWAREGLAGARGVLVGSRHTGESLWAAMDDASVRERTRLGPPGVDVKEFSPREPAEAAAGLARLAERLAALPPSGHGGFARDPAEAARALQDLAAGLPGASPTASAPGASPPAGRTRLVVFVGKLIASKGVELLIAAWPAVAAAHPDARLVIVGFGAWRAGLEQLAALLAEGDVDGARALRAEDGRELPELAAFLDRPLPDAYDAAALRDVRFTGRLEHAELADLLPAAEALVAPSTFPEAFGMVAAEGAAAGAMPVVARHSGLAEVSEALAEHVPDAARPALSFAVGPTSVDELAACLTSWLGVSEDVRAATRDAIVAVTRERWSWDGVARTVVAAAQGELDDLPRVL